MPYSDQIPQPTDVLRNSQNDLLNNFQSILPAFELNHITFNDAGAGKHKFITMPEQSAAPATGANELGMYSKESTLTGASELFIRRESSGDEIEATGADLGVIGWSYLPSGLLIKWGVDTCTGDDTFIIPSGASVPDFTTILSIQLTVANGLTTDLDHAIRATSSTLPDTIRVYASNRTTTGPATVEFEYLLIGI